MAKIRLLADAAGGAVRVALGSPGHTVELFGELRDTGTAWGAGRTLDAFLLGIGAALDDTYRTRINNLIAAYNQLRLDYNSATVPTSAPEIPPLT